MSITARSTSTPAIGHRNRMSFGAVGDQQKRRQRQKQARRKKNEAKNDNVDDEDDDNDDRTDEKGSKCNKSGAATSKWKLLAYVRKVLQRSS